MADPNPNARRSKSQRLSLSKSERLGRSKSQRLLRSSSGRNRRPSGRLARPSVPESLVGKVVGGNYRITAPLGGDRLSTLYEATVDAPLEGEANEVAVRVVHPQLLDVPGLDRRVLTWAASLCALEHPRVVRTREYGREEDVLYVVIDACPGRSLDVLLREAGPLPLERCLALASQTAEALAAAHAVGLVHQQLTPACLLLDAEDQLRMTGLGLTAPLDAPSTHVLALDLSTAKYASPELAADATQDERSDVYALGLILYELVCGQLPFEGFFVDQLLKARVGQPPPPTAERSPSSDVPAELEAVLQRALAPDPEARYPSAMALHEALATIDLPPPTDDAELQPEPLDTVAEVSVPGLESALRVSLARHDGEVGLTWVLDTPARRQRLLNEYERTLDAAKRVEHPSLAPLVAHGPHGDRQLLAYSRWGGGPTAHARIDAGPLPEAKVVRLLRPLLEGLALAHAQGVSHGLIAAQLLEVGDRPRLHGLGVVPAARACSSPPSVDVRDLALVMLQLLAGVHLEETSLESLRERGLAKVDGVLLQVLETATGPEPYRNAEVMLEVLEVDPRFRRRHPLALVVGGLVGIALTGALAFAIRTDPPPVLDASPSASVRASSSPGPQAEPTLREPGPAPTPSLAASGAPLPATTPSASTQPPLDPPSEGLTPPDWYASLPPQARPPQPLPAGIEFGADSGEYVLTADESVLVWVPAAQVFLGKHEVTWDRYLAFCKQTDHTARRPAFRVSRRDPVHYVSWTEAQAYAEWVGARLPTGEEWELAAGPGPYPWGDTPPAAELANLRGDEDGHPHTSPTGRFPAGASPSGAQDMAGNVAEWVADRVGRHERGVRGGGWFAQAWDCRNAWRGHADPRRRLDHLGFRLAVDP